MKRLIYVSNARIPSEKANSNQSMHQCEAFAEHFDVEFWHSSRRNPMAGADPFAYYGVRPTFRLRRLRAPDAPFLWRIRPRLGFLFETASFATYTAAGLLFAPRGAQVYTRHEFDAYLLPLVRLLRRDLRIFYEDIDGFLRNGGYLRARLLRAFDGIVAIARANVDLLVARGIAREGVLLAPLGAKVADFAALGPATRSESVRVLYVGNLYAWKGVNVLAEAAGLLPSRYRVRFVGGSPETLTTFRTAVADLGVGTRVDVVGHVAPSAVPAEIADAHVLVLPNSGKHWHSADFTSPLKLFEYMASGRPIVASDVPAVRDVLRHGENAWLVEPDDPEALAEGIRRVGDDAELAARLGARAKKDVQEHDWSVRARRILRFMEGRR